MNSQQPRKCRGGKRHERFRPKETKEPADPAAQMAKLPRPPTFATHAEERLHRKQDWRRGSACFRNSGSTRGSPDISPRATPNSPIPSGSTRSACISARSRSRTSSAATTTAGSSRANSPSTRPRSSFIRAFTPRGPTPSPPPIRIRLTAAPFRRSAVRWRRSPRTPAPSMATTRSTTTSAASPSNSTKASGSLTPSARPKPRFCRTTA